MCGIAAIVGTELASEAIARMVAVQRHRGPNDEAIYVSPSRSALLGHNRLSILDLSPAGRQPMAGRQWRLVFNGEIYNYLELRREFSEYAFHSSSDSEVLLAAIERDGPQCLDKLLGMFAFAAWNESTRTLFAARDRFGVKPLYYHLAADGTLYLASEIKALHAAGVPECPDEGAWASYLAYGSCDRSERTFWQGIRALPAGHALTWQAGQLAIRPWYDIAERVGSSYDTRPLADVEAEYEALLIDAVRLRFRADVPVGINLSGGLDSSALLAMVHAVQGPESNVRTFTYITGDDRYDEWPWVEKMLAHTRHRAEVVTLSPAEVPELAESIALCQDEPFGGLPTVAYAKVFERARALGVLVLLDGQGMDEQWAGYDYYQQALAATGGSIQHVNTVQGTKEKPTRADCLLPEFAAQAEPLQAAAPFADGLRNLQYRDIRYSKIPRALRFNDRISMRVATELREPFLDHRLVELALRQPAERKIQGETRKWLLRKITARLAPRELAEAPKRALQTPQREWLRGPLAEWAHDCVEQALEARGHSWLEPERVRRHFQSFLRGESDNSFYVWQWISLAMAERRRVPAAA